MSKLRCRPGDLAVVVQANFTPEMLGRLVEVVRMVLPGEHAFGGLLWQACEPGQFWLIRPYGGGALPTRGNAAMFYVSERPFPDYALRPIRPNDGEDESLSWSKPLLSELKEKA